MAGKGIWFPWFLSSVLNTTNDRSLSNRSTPSLEERKEDTHPSHGIWDSVEDTADGAMEAASFAVTARDARGITFFAAASAAFFTGADMALSAGIFFGLACFDGSRG